MSVQPIKFTCSLIRSLIRSMSVIFPTEPRSIFITALFFILLLLQNLQMIDLKAQVSQQDPLSDQISYINSHLIQESKQQGSKQQVSKQQVSKHKQQQTRFSVTQVRSGVYVSSTPLNRVKIKLKEPKSLKRSLRSVHSLSARALNK